MLHRIQRRARWLPLACLMLAGSAAQAASDRPPSGLRLVGTAGPAALGPTRRAAIRTIVARRGESRMQLLPAAGVVRAEAEPAITALAPLLPARPLPPGRALSLRH